MSPVTHRLSPKDLPVSANFPPLPWGKTLPLRVLTLPVILKTTRFRSEAEFSEPTANQVARMKLHPGSPLDAQSGMCSRYSSQLPSSPVAGSWWRDWTEDALRLLHIGFGDYWVARRLGSILLASLIGWNLELTKKAMESVWLAQWDFGKENSSYFRASPVVQGYAFASRNEKWPPSIMQMQTQA